MISKKLKLKFFQIISLTPEISIFSKENKIKKKEDIGVNLFSIIAENTIEEDIFESHEENFFFEEKNFDFFKKWS